MRATESGHTPAPWGYTWSEGEVEIFDGTYDNPGCEKLYIYVGGESLICSKADARLMAAAPELLEALESIVSDSVSLEQAMEAARAAIRKARGETS